VAGVAGGLGEFTGVDPVLFRVLFAVLTLFGGSGLLLYAVGWLFLPAADQQASPVESLIGRNPGGSRRARDTAAALALVLAGLVLAGVLALGDARDLALVLILVGGGFFLIRNLQDRRAGGPPQPAGPEPYQPAPAAYETVPPTGATAYQPGPAAYQPAQPAYQPAAPAYQGATATVTAPPPVPKPRREHSILGVLTICVLLIVVGITAALDSGDATHPATKDYLALATGIIGLGLLVGTFLGRARWLAWLGLPSLALLVVVSTSGISLEGGVGTRVYTPQSVAELQPEYRLGVGDLRIDLSDLVLPENELLRIKASTGVGDVDVILPADADVSIDGKAGLGELDLLGQTEDGTSPARTIIDHGPGAGDGAVDLALDLDVNIGQVRVTRAQA
jgi:phage shock protein PspC (stress-responsive transcriptional regulator)